MSSIPTLAEHLAGAKPPKPGPPTRVHTLGEGTEDATAPRHRPFIDPEIAMPRKPKAATPAAEPKRRGPKPGSKRTRKDGLPTGAASFVIDDRGGMEIRDGQQSVKLERDDVKRLGQFIERTKTIAA